MASSPSASRLTESHRLAQARIGADTVRQMLAAWSLLRFDDLDGSFPDWLRVVIPLVAAQRRLSATLAANYLGVFRAVEIGVGVDTLRPVLADSLPVDALTTSMLITGPARIRSALARKVAPQKALSTAAAGAAAAAMRHALNGGRDTITETVKADARAIGWARATSGTPCSFCAMLASRGPVYKSKAGAEGSRDDRVKCHDSCHCTPEPVFRPDAEWPAGSRRFQELWEQHATGPDPANAFRRALAAA